MVKKDTRECFGYKPNHHYSFTQISDFSFAYLKVEQDSSPQLSSKLCYPNKVFRRDVKIRKFR